METLNTNADSAAQMSVVVVTPDRYENIRKTMKHLQAQTVSDQLEIVIVVPSAATLDFDAEERAAFDRLRIVEIGEIKSTGRAIAAGVRQANAPVVTYAEEHSYPAPGWAEALIKAHRESWAVVGVAIANANPGNIISWASLFTDFGPWVEPVEAGETNHLAWHHSSYKRAVLLEYGSELDVLLEAEGILHKDLLARGHRLYLESAAKTNHVNISLLVSYMAAEFHGARMFAANRASGAKWSVLWRLLYISALPLIPFVRLTRVLGHIFRSGHQRELLPRILPALILGLAADTAGQLMGYAFGAGNAARRRVSFELNRYQHVTAQDKAGQMVAEVNCPGAQNR
jgi:glycosyltransferase involved in cell wall biosynthesis